MSNFAQEQEEEEEKRSQRDSLGSTGSSIETAIDIEEDVNVQLAKEYYQVQLEIAKTEKALKSIETQKKELERQLHVLYESKYVFVSINTLLKAERAQRVIGRRVRDEDDNVSDSIIDIDLLSKKKIKLW